MSVIFISAELEEVLRLTHRVGVLRDRRKVADIDNEDLSVADIMAVIADGSRSRGGVGMIKVITHRLFWPVVLLLVLFVVNLIAFPGFFRIEIKDGHLFGSLIDILRNGAPT